MKHSTKTACGLILALSFVATAAFAQDPTEADQGTDAAAQATAAASSAASSVSPLLTNDQDVQAWQQTVKQMSPSQVGCFQSSYPDTEWQQVPCAQPQPQPQLQSESLTSPHPAQVSKAFNAASAAQKVVGTMGISTMYPSYGIVTPAGSISSAEGSFINVTGVNSITDSSN